VKGFSLTAAIVAAKFILLNNVQMVMVVLGRFLGRIISSQRRSKLPVSSSDAWR
jgi:hypothetical protein